MENELNGTTVSTLPLLDLSPLFPTHRDQARRSFQARRTDNAYAFSRDGLQLSQEQQHLLH